MSTQPATGGTEWTISRLLTWTSEYLARHGIDDPRLASEVLLAHTAGWRRIDLYARFDDVLDAKTIERFRGLVRRAAAHEPVAYLVGEKEFFSLPFKVTPDVLIPRPETETLVEVAIDHCTKAGLTHPRVLDVGTGSGCIAVAVLVQLHGARAVGTDVSPAALDLARRNAERHGVLDRLTLIEADQLALPDRAVPAGGFDVLISNPPYVAADAMQTLDQPVRDYEPPLALTDGTNGLSFYRSIATEAPRLLAPDGVVILEVGDGQAQAVLCTFEEIGGFSHRATVKDRVVGHDRVLMFASAGKA